MGFIGAHVGCGLTTHRNSCVIEEFSFSYTQMPGVSVKVKSRLGFEFAGARWPRVTCTEQWPEMARVPSFGDGHESVEPSRRDPEFELQR